MNSLIDTLMPLAMVTGEAPEPARASAPSVRDASPLPSAGVTTALGHARLAANDSGDAALPPPRSGASMTARVGWLAAAVLLVLLALWAVTGPDEPATTVQGGVTPPPERREPVPAASTAVIALPPKPEVAQTPPTTAAAVPEPSQVAPRPAPARAAAVRKTARRAEASGPRPAAGDEATLFSGRK